MKRKILLIIGVLFLLIGLDSWAEEEDVSDEKYYNIGEIIVTATKTEIHQGEVGSSTTVITADDIKKSGKRTVLDVLRDVPGVSIMQNGGFGGLASLYLRGAASGQTLVMIDGVEVNDPMSSDRSFDFAHLPTDNIEQIEVVRGPQSPLYGSDAMAGVINIITKKGKGKPTLEASFEGGSHNTFRENLSSRGSFDKFDYSLSVSRLDSDGITKASLGDEKDGYRNTAVFSKLGYKIFDNSELSLVVNYTDSKTAIDGGSYNDDPNYNGWWKDLSTKVAFDQELTSCWNHRLSFSYHDIRRRYRDSRDPLHYYSSSSWYKGDTKKGEWQHNFSPVKGNTFTAGFEYEEESGKSYYESEFFGWPYVSKQGRTSIDNKGYYFQDQLVVWEKLFITPGVRIDDHEVFGSHTTYKLSLAYLIPQTGTRLKGNWGTGFKAPTIYQLYDASYGNDDLKPEKSKGYDFGFEQHLFNDRVSCDVTYFHNRFKNMITWVMTDPWTWEGEYRNIGKAITKGFEFAAKVRVLDNLTLGGNYTYTDTEDKSTGLSLARRPRRQAGGYVDWAFLPNANLQCGLTYVGKRRDSDYNTYTDNSYTTVRLAASYEVTKNFQIFGRIENLCDKHYHEIYGYKTLGRSFYGGIKGSF